MTKQWSDRVGRRLNLRDLHIFLTVADLGSMGKAASSLAVSQPAVSRAIANLEQSVGVRLLDRSPQGIVPTSYGRALLRSGTAIFDDLRQGIKEIEFLADPSVGEIVIGCTEPMSAGFVAAVTSRLVRRYPKAVFRIVTTDPATLLDHELRQRTVDLVLMPLTGQRLQDDVEVETLFSDRHVILAGAKSEWARRRNISLADLIDEPWILPPPDSLIGSYIAAGFRAAGLQPPRANVLSYSIPLHHHLLATGSFLTTLWSSMADYLPYLPLKKLSVEFHAELRPIVIAMLKQRIPTPLARVFIECARDLARPAAGLNSSPKLGQRRSTNSGKLPRSS